VLLVPTLRRLAAEHSQPARRARKACGKQSAACTKAQAHRHTAASRSGTQPACRVASGPLSKKTALPST
jgi:hypothetical protein